jgi:hypothetical protein
MKDCDGKYISFAKEVFVDFFKITDCQEQTITIETTKETNETNIDEHDDDGSDNSYNSELACELYEYSDEEST